MYQLRRTQFDKLDFFNISYSVHRKLFENTTVFDFEWICVQKDQVRDTDTTTWIGKHIQKFVSISSNFIEQPIILCNSKLGRLLESFFDALDELAKPSKAQIKIKFLESETNVNSELNQVFSAPNQRRCRKEPVSEFEDECIEEEEEEQNLLT